MSEATDTLSIPLLFLILCRGRKGGSLISSSARMFVCVFSFQRDCHWMFCLVRIVAIRMEGFHISNMRKSGRFRRMTSYHTDAKQKNLRKSRLFPN